MAARGMLVLAARDTVAATTVIPSVLMTTAASAEVVLQPASTLIASIPSEMVVPGMSSTLTHAETTTMLASVLTRTAALVNSPQCNHTTLHLI